MASSCCRAAGKAMPCHDRIVYDVASGKEIVTYTGHDNIVLATAFSPDGRWAATGGGDKRRFKSGTRIRASPGLDPMASRCGSPARGSRSGRRGSRPMGGASAGGMSGTMGINDRGPA